MHDTWLPNKEYLWPFLSQVLKYLHRYLFPIILNSLGDKQHIFLTSKKALWFFVLFFYSKVLKVCTYNIFLTNSDTYLFIFWGNDRSGIIKIDAVIWWIFQQTSKGTEMTPKTHTQKFDIFPLFKYFWTSWNQHCMLKNGLCRIDKYLRILRNDEFWNPSTHIV